VGREVGRKRRIGQVFAGGHWVSLYQAARQVAAQLAEQQLGQILEHSQSPTPVLTGADFPSDVAKPHLKGDVFYAGTLFDVTALRIR
jgi:hypothetical protein